MAVGIRRTEHFTWLAVLLEFRGFVGAVFCGFIKPSDLPPFLTKRLTDGIAARRRSAFSVNAACRIDALQ